jgi:hypothetical protein
MDHPENARMEYETLLRRTEPQPALPPPRVPWPAKKAIIVAVLLCVLGFACVILSLATFGESAFLSKNRSGRWPLLIFGFLAIPSGAYTLYLASLIYHRTPGYYWPMIFF